MICELRRGHPKWGPRRLVFEMGRRGHGQVTRSTVYRTLVRNGLVEPKSRRRRRKDYRRWERSTPIELWQLDVTASAFLTDGTEVKIVTGIDDHSRFCVIAKAVTRATARPVCLAFVDAMRVYGIPEEVLTTGRCSPAGSTSRACRWRCCLTGSAGRTASPTGSRRTNRWAGPSRPAGSRQHPRRWSCASRPSSLRARASRSHRRQVWVRYQHRACPGRQRQALLQALASLRWR